MHRLRLATEQRKVEAVQSIRIELPIGESGGERALSRVTVPFANFCENFLNDDT